MKIPKQACTTECKELAVKRIKDGQSVSAVYWELGLALTGWSISSARRVAMRMAGS
jgi:hypothetical protein